MLSAQLAEQAKEKVKADLMEMKEEKRRNEEQMGQKLRYVEQQKAELAAKEETMRESLA